MHSVSLQTKITYIGRRLKATSMNNHSTRSSFYTHSFNVQFAILISSFFLSSKHCCCIIKHRLKRKIPLLISRKKIVLALISDLNFRVV
ncbi:hypothetical protein PUN28_009976 [Cardiocondyla obscurior]|uniref:Uncharacterized protein n=1 Tax=Cardiocondyla obscurior TaxID=286306 RepID=A0AAW2FMT4_9HYME